MSLPSLLRRTPLSFRESMVKCASAAAPGSSRRGRRVAVSALATTLSLASLLGIVATAAPAGADQNSDLAAYTTAGGSTSSSLYQAVANDLSQTTDVATHDAALEAATREVQLATHLLSIYYSRGGTPSDTVAASVHGDISSGNDADLPQAIAALEASMIANGAPYTSLSLTFHVGGGGDSLTLPITGTANWYDLSIAWSDQTDCPDVALTCDVTTGNTDVSVTVLDFNTEALAFGSQNSWPGVQSLTSVNSWSGDWSSLAFAFAHATNLQSVPSTLPSSVTNLTGTFYASTFNQDISSWNTDNVTTMQDMFLNDTSFSDVNYGLFLHTLALETAASTITHSELDSSSYFMSSAQPDRSMLIGDHWVISDNGLDTADSIQITSTPPNDAYANDGGGYEPTATVQSGNSVTISVDSSSTSNCSITNGIVTWTTGGTCVLNFSTAGGSGYLSASATQSFVIAPTNTMVQWQSSQTQGPLSVAPFAGTSAISCVSSTFCVGTGIYGYTSPGGPYSGEVSMFHGGIWTSAKLVGPSLYQGDPVDVTSISCTSTTFCVVGGQVEVAPSAWLPAVDQYDGTSWTPTFIAQTIPNTTGAGTVTSVSCSGTTCVAGGEYTDTSNLQQAYVSVLSGGAWTDYEVAGALNVHGIAEVNGVSCSSTHCLAGGYYYDAGHIQRAFTSTFDGTSWTDGEVGASLGAGGANVTSVSCSDVLCAAGGTYVDSSSNNQALVSIYNGTSWTDSEVAGSENTGGEAGVSSVACLNDGCLAGGSYAVDSSHADAFISTYSNAQWTTTEVASSLNVGANASVSGVACSTTICGATGSYVDAQGYDRAFASTYENSGWVSSEIEGTVASGDPVNPLTISCAEPAFCAIGGFYQYGNPLFASFFVVPFVNATVPSIIGDTVRGANNALEEAGFSLGTSTGVTTAGATALNNGEVATQSVSGTAMTGTTVNYTTYSYTPPLAQTWTDSEVASDLNLGNVASIVSVTCVSSVFCAAGGSYQDSSGATQALVALYNGSSWSDSPVALSLNTGGGGHVWSVSCATSTSCMAVGTSTDTSGHEWGFTSSYDGSTWTTNSLPDPFGAGSNLYLGTVSCSSASFCLAGGDYEDSSSHYQAMLAVFDGAEWIPYEVATQLNTGQNAAVQQVTCLSSTFCVAIGQFSNSGLHSFATIFTGLTSTDTQIADTLPSEVSDNVNAISCVSASFCVVGGSYQSTTQYNIPFVSTFDGTSWTDSVVGENLEQNPDGAVTTVSCASTSFCVAGGSYLNSSAQSEPFVSTLNGNSWSDSAIATDIATGSPGEVNSVSCVSSTSCVAVGGYFNSASYGLPFEATFNGTSWSDEPLAHLLDQGGQGEALSVFCVSSTFCATGGDYRDSTFGFQAFASVLSTSGTVPSIIGETVAGATSDLTSAGFVLGTATGTTSVGATAQNDGDIASQSLSNSQTLGSAVDYTTYAYSGPSVTWTYTEIANDVNLGHFALTSGLSCPSTTFCAAVGVYADSGDGRQVFEAVMVDGAWSDSPLALSLNTGNYASPGGISCVSTAFCMVVGSYRDSASDNQSFASIFNGTSWTDSEVPAPSGAVQSSLSDVSCITDTFCVASGSYVDQNGNTKAEVAIFNGATWTVSQQAASLNVGSSASNDVVDCVTTSFCVSGGTYSSSVSANQAYVSVFNGTSWADEAVAQSLNGAGDGYVNAISCASTTFCAAGGGVSPTHGVNEPFVSVFNGTSWADEAVAQSLNGAGDGYITGVSCTSSSFCVAQGDYLNGSGTNEDFVSVYNGISWTDSEIAGGLAYGASYAGEITCLSSNFCAATGYYQEQGGRDVALLSTYDGSSWSDSEFATQLNQGDGSAAQPVTCISPTACVVGGLYIAGLQMNVEAFVATDFAVVPDVIGDSVTAAAAALRAAGFTVGGSAGVTTIGATPQNDGEIATQSLLGAAPDGSTITYTTYSYIAPGATWTSTEVGGEFNAGNFAGSFEPTCVSSSFCVSGGFYIDANHDGQAMVSVFNGTSWADEAVPSLNGAGYGYVNATSCFSSTFCVVGGGYMDGSSHLQSFVSLFNGTTWSDVEIAGQLNVGNISQVTSITCLSTSFCVAGGYYLDSQANEQAFISIYNGISWSDSEVAGSLNLGSQATVNEITCTSTSFCVAGGYYSDSTNITKAFVSVFNGVSWSDVEVGASLNTANGASQIESVSCTSTSFCVAGGNYTNNTGESVALVSIFDGTSWTDQSDGTSTAASAIGSVRCLTTTFCVAGGDYTYSDNTQQAFVSQFDGNSWTSQTVELPQSGLQSSLGHISCGSTTYCVADGIFTYPNTSTQAFATVFDGTSWTTSEVASTLNVGGYAGVGNVDCTKQSYCIFGGNYADANGSQGFVATNFARVPSVAGDTPADAAPALASAGFTLGATRDEVTTGATAQNNGDISSTELYGDQLLGSSTNYATYDYNASPPNWTETEVGTALNNGNYGYVLSSQCLSESFCVAGGGYTPTQNHSQAFVSVFNGTTWTDSEIAGSLNQGGQASVGYVSCVSATFCVATGIYEDAATHTQNFVSVFNGSTWTDSEITTTLNQGGNGSVSGLTCLSSTFCAVAGTYLDGSGHYRPFVSTYNGTTWTDSEIAQNLGDGFDIDGISCTSSSFCVVGGDYSTQSGPNLPFVSVYDGHSWTSTSLATTIGSISQGWIFDVSCSSSTFCAAGGSYLGTDGVQRAFTAVFNGVSWTATQIASGADQGAAIVEQLTCLSNSFCVGTGFYDDNNNHSQAFVTMYDGITWTITELAGSLNSGTAYASGVECLSTTDCVVVGGYTDNASNTQGFVSQYNGTVWTDSEVTNSFASGLIEAMSTPSCFGPSECIIGGAYWTGLNAQAFVATTFTSSVAGLPTFSAAAAPVQVPSIVGLTVAQASSALATAGFTLGSATGSTTTGATAANNGEIATQSVTGAQAQGTVVNYTTYHYLATVTVPAIVGDTVAQASAALASAGLVLGSATGTITVGATAQNNGTIASQSVSGTQPVGTTVNYTTYKFVVAVPGAPGIKAAASGTSKIKVTLTHVAASAAPLRGYEVSVNGGAWQKVTFTAAHTVVLNVKTGKHTYELRVRALNSAGPGASSAVVKVTLK